MSTRTVVLDGGSPWGFRIHGGKDCQQPIRISRVNPGSKAASRGIREGDLVTSINGQPTRELTNAEAHAVLKNAGETLQLGLNENVEGSPKRRQQHRTLHQEERHSETIKRSTFSSTTYTSSSNEQPPKPPVTKTKELSKDIESPQTSSACEKALASDKSTPSSNRTSLSSALSTLPAETERNGNSDSPAVDNQEALIMSDNATRSRRRSRRRKQKRNPTPVSNDAAPVEADETEKTTQNEVSEAMRSTVEVTTPVSPDYKVEYPDVTIKTVKSAPLSKSKSLDDCESLKITELSEVSENEDKNECNAVVSEVESEAEWNTADEFIDDDVPKQETASLNDCTPALEECKEQRVNLISPEDELNLRNFLEGLNLVKSPEESPHHDAESIRERRARKREAWAQYFIPAYQNPRYLDVISEESSDLSDKEQSCDKPNNKARAINLQRRMQSHFCRPKSDIAILVPTKITEIPKQAQDVCSTSVAEKSSGAEIVYLHDSSSDSADDGDDETTGEEEHFKPDITLSSQLTPPPTPGSLSPKSETKSFNSEMLAFTEQALTCLSSRNPELLDSVLSDKHFSQLPEEFKKKLESLAFLVKEQRFEDSIRPPPSRSPSFSSNGSSSRATSLCTARYNPSSSSLVDIASMVKDEVLFQPQTLRELCVNFLLSLPFGAEVLQELAEVSKNLERFTVYKYPKIKPDIIPAFISKSEIMCNKSAGLPTKLDEVDKLLNLHENFTQRRAYHDEIRSVESTKNENIQITLTSDKVSNRLLAMFREASTGVQSDTDPAQERSIDNDYLYYEEKESSMRPEFTRSCSVTLPKATARLQARSLSEWLQLARGKSTTDINNLAARSKHHEPVKTDRKRRSSLPNDIYQRQLLDLMEKEREIQRELERLEDEKRKLQAEMASQCSKRFHPEEYKISKKGDIAVLHEKTERPLSMPVAPTEFFRQQMYEEYMEQVAAREERKQNKVIKISTHTHEETKPEPSNQIIHIPDIGDEFLDQVKKRKLGGCENEESADDGPKSEEEDDVAEPVLVLDGNSVTGAKGLPKHLQEFVDITRQMANTDVESDEGVWSPGQKRSPPREPQRQDSRDSKDDSVPVVWTPRSAGTSPVVERKEFRPVNFESPVLGRKNKPRLESQSSADSSAEPPWKVPGTASDSGIALSSSLDRRIPVSRSAPSASGFSDYTTPRLPRVQNPTVTLLQKAREGQFPRGALYIDQEEPQYPPRRNKYDRPSGVGPGDVVYQIKREYSSESDGERPRRMAELGPRKFQGVGPTTKDGMPIILRSEVRDADQSRWYKKMYDTIHKQRRRDDEYVTVRYRQPKSRPYQSGYFSEPEPGAYDSDTMSDYKYATLDRRRPPPRPVENNYSYNNYSATVPRNSTSTTVTYPPPSNASSVIKPNPEVYKNQPGRIENYIPGHSSISDKEAKRWWDEVMDIFDGHLEQQKHVPPQNRSYMNQALKESGYESDSTLVFKRRDDTAQQLSPQEQKEAYKTIQKGGDVPLQGLRKPAPERPKVPLAPPPPPPKGQHGVKYQETESPRKYVENEVTIHYKTPVRQEVKEVISEEELAKRQAEAMKKIYEEERRRKYLQVSNSLEELQDMTSRRHTDNFIPSQKSPIALDRYDDFVADLSPKVKPRPRSPEPRLIARALYNFVGQSARELTFRKGDIIYVRRQVDKNWYEGELNAMIGLFPANYVEIVPYDGLKITPRKSYEGQARAKYNFLAQTHLELSLAKGELVVLTRRVDDNWFEGKIGGRKGIFPVSYVDVLIDPSEAPPPSTKPVASPAAHSILLNGSSGGKESMGSHSYTPNCPPQLTTSYHAKPVQVIGSGTYGSVNRSKNPVNQELHVDTQSEPIPYRALYKYLPQNDDELELLEGDTVYVLEKCDDGWFVGSSERTGAFGTFPGNYVERI